MRALCSRLIACSVPSRTLFCVLLCLAIVFPLKASSDSSAGIAWRVRGLWRAAGKDLPIQNGDPVRPSALLMPGDDSGNHSITVLLPDGQRVLYECFTAADCERGFRVPALTRRPSPFEMHMLASIRAALAASREQFGSDAGSEQGLQISRDEAVAVIDHAHIHLSGLIADLSPGHYTFDLRPLRSDYPPQNHQPLEKRTNGIDLTVPGPGLYILTITDALHTPRVNLFFAAVAPEQAAGFASFGRAREVMEDWNGDYGGWPVDDFLRAYLESLAR